MGRVRDVQQFIDSLRDVRTPKGLEQILADIAIDMGFDLITMFHHVDLSRISQSLAHMRRGELVGITTAPLSWSEYYRDHNFVAVDPRVLATRRTVSPFRTGDVGRIIQVTSTQRAVIESQRRANLGEGFTIPVHFPGEPSGSCTFIMACGRSLPTQNFAMAQWVGNSAFQAARTMVNNVRHPGAPATRPRLTERQLQCTLFVGRGLAEGAIAKRLGIASETVKRHLKEARQAYGVTKSVQLVTHSLHDGQITLRDLLAEDVSKLH
ncbi:MAG TPA: LuxR family transcriptional regulator [Allosphingosinicella sp.]|nr:LuxR family transcriptional regulator [Allosphingosinicella sp.]